MDTRKSHLIDASRKFFGFALSHEPAELYDTIKRPRPSSLATVATDYLVQNALERYILTRDDQSEVRSLFFAAVSETQTILTNLMYSHHLQIDQLPIIARDERTARTIATLALREDKVMRTHISAESQGVYFDLSEDASHIVPTDRLKIPPENGCPFASSGDRVPNPAPIFKRTIHFAADLTALALSNTDKK